MEPKVVSSTPTTCSVVGFNGRRVSRTWRPCPTPRPTIAAPLCHVFAPPLLSVVEHLSAQSALRPSPHSPRSPGPESRAAMAAMAELQPPSHSRCSAPPHSPRAPPAAPPCDAELVAPPLHLSSSPYRVVAGAGTCRGCRARGREVTVHLQP
jgi:hypothetical protein